MLRHLDINVANTPKPIKGKELSKQLSTSGEVEKQSSCNNNNNIGLGKGKPEPIDEVGEKKMAKEVARDRFTYVAPKQMAARHPDMRFTYLPPRDKYENTFARMREEESFKHAVDDWPEEEGRVGDDFDIFADFDENELQD